MKTLGCHWRDVFRGLTRGGLVALTDHPTRYIPQNEKSVALTYPWLPFKQREAERSKVWAEFRFKKTKMSARYLESSKGKDEATSISTTTMKKHYITGRHSWDIDYTVSLFTP